MITNTRIHHINLRSGIHRTREFEKKGLATHLANVGLKCNHDCTYCSKRTHTNNETGD